MGGLSSPGLLTTLIDHLHDDFFAAVTARLADVSRTYLSKLEKGASYPGLEITAKLATVLEVNAANCW